MPELVMTSFTLDAIVKKGEDAIVVDYIEKRDYGENPDGYVLPLPEQGWINTAYGPQPAHHEFFPSDMKLGVQELCPVCGDKVSGYHYGLLTCESCKGFFKRTVQNKKVYSCVDNRGCQIDKSQRKRCPYCRFQKCLLVGMKLEAVREDRMRGGRNKFGPMYKRDRALKQQALRQHQHLIASCHMQDITMATDDVKPDRRLLLAESNYSCSSATHIPKENSSNHYDGYTITNSLKDIYVGHSSMTKEAYPRSLRNPVSKLPPYPTHSMTFSNEYYSTSSVGANQEIDVNRNICENKDKNVADFTRPHEIGCAVDINRNVTLDRNKNIRDDLVTGATNLGGRDFDVRASTHHRSRVDVGESRSVEYNLQDKVHASYETNCSYIPKLIQQLQVTMLDEVQIRNKLMSFLQSDIDELDALQRPQKFLHIMCQLADQCLFLMVEWARSSVFFKDLRVECQMRLLHHCWCEQLILDFIHRQLQHSQRDKFVLASGHVISASYFDGLGLSDIKERLQDIAAKLHELDFDYNEYACLKFIILLNPDRSTGESKLYVEQYQEQVNAALLEYCMTFHVGILDKFGQLLHRLPEIRALSIRLEEFLYYKHLNREIPEQTLLMEMLHSKHK